MVNTLEGIRGAESTGASRRLHLHFFSSPKEILGEDGKVTGIRIERTELDGNGGVIPIGEYRDYPVQAVYRAVGYFGSELAGIPFDSRHGVIPNLGGRVIDSGHQVLPGIYATGWIKRGPVGLIGHTKSDAMETVSNVLADQSTWWQPTHPGEESIVELLKAKNVQFLGWPEWLKIDATEKALGAASGRERIKLVDREDFLDVAFKKD